MAIVNDKNIAAAVTAVTEKLAPNVGGVKIGTTQTSNSKPAGENVNHARDKANDVNDPSGDGNNGNGSDSYGGYGGYGGGNSAEEPAKKNWSASDITSNPNAQDPYLNPDAAKQNEALQAALNGNPTDYLAGTEGILPTTEDNLAAADALMAGAGIGGKDYYEGAGITGDVNIDRIGHVNIDEEKAMLDQIRAAQERQAILNANRTVETGTTSLQRQLEDSQKQFQTQKDQIAADEARAKDNQALYSEARGDRGGIGQAQYDSIMNTAATNRYMVQQEQSKLAQDVQRQITDLRSQGEFEKADQLLNISQNYLSQLMNLFTWAKETNLSVDEFNSQIAQWEENYKLSLLNAELDVSNMRLNLANFLQSSRLNNLNAQLSLAQAAQQGRLNDLNAQLSIAEATGAYADGTPTWQARMSAIQQLANSGNALLQAGIAPTSEQLVAMGLTQDQALAYLKKYFPYG